jgi:hypothetical protein
MNQAFYYFIAYKKVCLVQRQRIKLIKSLEREKNKSTDFLKSLVFYRLNKKRSGT